MMIDMFGRRDVKLHRRLVVLEKLVLDEFHFVPVRHAVFARNAEVIPITLG